MIKPTDIDEIYLINLLLKSTNNELLFLLDTIISRNVTFKPIVKAQQVKPIVKVQQVKPIVKGREE